MKRDKQYCACGECAARAKVATVEMRYCPFTDLELAQLRKARRVTGAKLAALMPAWLKRELAKPLPLFKFVPDKAPVYPNLGRGSVASKNPAPDVFGTDSYGARYLRDDMTTAEYVAAYDKAVVLVSQV